AVAAIGQHDVLGAEALGDVTRQRRGQVVAQRQPLLVVVLEREYALVRPVLIGQEFAERVGVLDRRRRRDLGGAAVGQPARQARFEFLRLFRLFVHGRAYIADGPDTATSYA